MDLVGFFEQEIRRRTWLDIFWSGLTGLCFLSRKGARTRSRGCVSFFEDLVGGTGLDGVGRARAGVGLDGVGWTGLVGRAEDSRSVGLFFRNGFCRSRSAGG